MAPALTHIMQQHILIPCSTVTLPVSNIARFNVAPREQILQPITDLASPALVLLLVQLVPVLVLVFRNYSGTNMGTITFLRAT